ncbi:MAG: TolC family outer membrane protein [Legionellaceae bacterium]|nr:TolC family outer membrane protein [Legionellaceae bacterium]
MAEKKSYQLSLINFLVSLFVLILFTTTSHATDLLDVYFQSVDNDPKFKEAYAKFKQESEKLPIAWSRLLPQLTLDALINRNSQFVDTGRVQVNQRYNGNEWRVSASQTIFNYRAWQEVQKANSYVKMELAKFNNEAQSLILRTSNAYFKILLARDTLAFAESKKHANHRQLEQAQQRFNVGVDAITSVYEAQAAYDQSISEVIAAKNRLINQNHELSRITNHIYEYLSPIRNSRMPLVKPEPNNVDDWVDTGLKQNYKLHSAKYALQAARDNIKAQSAGNWPVFSIQGSVTDTHLDAGADRGLSPRALLADVFIPNERKLTAVSINMNLPIFQGGLVASRTREAKFHFQAIGQQLESTYREVIVTSNVAFNTIIDGISKVKADRKTIESQKNSLKSVSAQYDVGMRTMTDVVLAQRNLFEAQKQLASDQYGLIEAILTLKYRAGSLCLNDLEEINSWLDTTRLDEHAPGKQKNICSLKSQQLLNNLPGIAR